MRSTCKKFSAAAAQHYQELSGLIQKSLQSKSVYISNIQGTLKQFWTKKNYLVGFIVTYVKIQTRIWNVDCSRLQKSSLIFWGWWGERGHHDHCALICLQFLRISPSELPASLRSVVPIFMMALTNCFFHLLASFALDSTKLLVRESRDRLSSENRSPFLVGRFLKQLLSKQLGELPSRNTVLFTDAVGHTLLTDLAKAASISLLRIGAKLLQCERPIVCAPA